MEHREYNYLRGENFITILCSKPTKHLASLVSVKSRECCLLSREAKRLLPLNLLCEMKIKHGVTAVPRIPEMLMEFSPAKGSMGKSLSICLNVLTELGMGLCKFSSFLLTALIPCLMVLCAH